MTKTVKFQPPFQRGEDINEATRAIDEEVAAFQRWLIDVKKQEPLTSYERGILKTYLLFVAQREG